MNATGSAWRRSRLVRRQLVTNQGQCLPYLGRTTFTVCIYKANRFMLLPSNKTSLRTVSRHAGTTQRLREDETVRNSTIPVWCRKMWRINRGRSHCGTRPEASGTWPVMTGAVWLSLCLVQSEQWRVALGEECFYCLCRLLPWCPQQRHQASGFIRV
jgi:hypothetical protein